MLASSSRVCYSAVVDIGSGHVVGWEGMSVLTGSDRGGAREANITYKSKTKGEAGVSPARIPQNNLSCPFTSRVAPSLSPVPQGNLLRSPFIPWQLALAVSLSWVLTSMNLLRVAANMKGLEGSIRCLKLAHL